ncbi:hypothetical protein D3C81_697110 [compost metagenome]
MGADHPDATVHHQRFGVQPHARALPGNRHRAVGRPRAQERRPGLGALHVALHFTAARRGSAPRTAAAHVAASGAATDQGAARGVLVHAAQRRRHQFPVVHRRIQRERLVLVDVEAQLTQVAALVLVGQRIDDRVVGRRQAVGGDHHPRWRFALAQALEQLLRRLGQHQVRRLQQHFALRRVDQCIQRRLGEVLPIKRFVLALPAVLARQVGHVTHRLHRQCRIDKLAADEACVGGLGAHPFDALGITEGGLGHGRHALPQQRFADIVQAFGRHTAPRLPERLEVGGHLAHLRPGHHHVTIAEVVFPVPVVIVILVIAATDHADHVVNHQQLVVHALVEAAEAAQHAAHVVEVIELGLAEGRVVDAQLEIGVRAGQRAQHLHIGDRRQLVDQHPHLDPATGGGQQFVDHQPRTVVGVEDVGLQVDAAGGAAQQVQPGHQRQLALIQDGGVVAWHLFGGFGHGAATERAQRRVQRAAVRLRALHRG